MSYTNKGYIETLLIKVFGQPITDKSKKILDSITKTTLPKFDEKWKKYEPETLLNKINEKYRTKLIQFTESCLNQKKRQTENEIFDYDDLASAAKCSLASFAIKRVTNGAINLPVSIFEELKDGCVK